MSFFSGAATVNNSVDNEFPNSEGGCRISPAFG